MALSALLHLNLCAVKLSVLLLTEHPTLFPTPPPSYSTHTHTHTHTRTHTHTHTHTRTQLCIALNDIDQVRRGVQELPEFINWSHFKEVMAAETSPEEADKADEALKGILSDMDQSILQELTGLTGDIAEKVRTS